MYPAPDQRHPLPATVPSHLLQHIHPCPPPRPLPVQVEVEIRRCLVNEFSTQDGTLCELCPVTYYNVNASQPCQNCPANAMCVRPSPAILAAEVRGGEGEVSGLSCQSHRHPSVPVPPCILATMVSERDGPYVAGWLSVVRPLMPSTSRAQIWFRSVLAGVRQW